MSRRLLLPLLNALGRRGWQGRQIGKLYMYAMSRSSPGGFNPALREAQECWHLAARTLLQKRYGIEPQGRTTNWGVWYSVLGTLKREEIRGDMFPISLHACGWAGLVACRISPALINRYYVGLIIILIVFGILSDWYFARCWFDPMWNATIRLRVVLRELATEESTASKEDKDDNKSMTASVE